MGDQLKQNLESEPAFTEAEISGAWNRCMNDLKVHDEASVKTSKEEIDTLLVFAGLFSGVLTAFIVQSYTLLQSNPGPDATVQLLAQISAQLASFHVGGEFINATINSNSTPPAVSILTEPVSSSSVRINVLWFSSLICSLSAASICILVKQWLNQYSSGLSSVSRRAALTRQHRNDCMKKWRVHHIVVLLPILLQSALGLFLAGLLELLWTLHRTVAGVATVFVALLGLFQLTTTVLPAFVQGCPYQSPQSLAFYIFIQLCKIPYNFGTRSELRMYSWRDREQSMVGGEMEVSLGLRMLATADLTFTDDIYFENVIRPCSYSIDWASHIKRGRWFRDVVDYRTSRFHAGGPDALASLALDTALRRQKGARRQPDVDNLLVSCLNNATPDWWQAHSPHSQILLDMTAVLHRSESAPYFADAFRLISNIRTHGAKNVLLQVEHVEIIVNHVLHCHEQGIVDDFLVAVDVLVHYAANPIHISDDDFPQTEANFAKVFPLLHNLYQLQRKPQGTNPIESQNKRQATKPTKMTGKLLELIPPILRTARRNPRMVHRDFVEMLVVFPWSGNTVSDPQRIRGLQRSTSWDQQRCEVFLAELDRTRDWLLLFELPYSAEWPQLADQVILPSKRQFRSTNARHRPRNFPSLLKLSAVCTRMPPRIPSAFIGPAASL